MITRSRIRRHWRAIVFLVGIVLVVFLLTTDNPSVWPLRNIIAYRLTRWWEDRVGAPHAGALGELHGCVHSDRGVAIPGATVLISERDGTVHQASADAGGCYGIDGVPAGRYVPMV